MVFTPGCPALSSAYRVRAHRNSVSSCCALAESAMVETHIVISYGARRCIQLEIGSRVEDASALADVVHHPADLSASISSGSFQTLGMAVVPCSARTLAAMATGNSDNLLTRAADVTLTERRPLVPAVRETPLNLIHIRNLETVTLAGAAVLPPVPAIYHRPRTIDHLFRQTVGKIPRPIRHRPPPFRPLAYSR
ncbi:UbiX family flavin prenyltransferase [Nocardia sp. CA-151230]|uniref:UbiX family flavin prenyltransferase n=1 Tax=Nocardia sp. CA-151230 TaxID=3239982 RepID=UPI003D93CE1B